MERNTKKLLFLKESKINFEFGDLTTYGQFIDDKLEDIFGNTFFIRKMIECIIREKSDNDDILYNNISNNNILDPNYALYVEILSYKEQRKIRNYIYTKICILPFNVFDKDNIKKSLDIYDGYIEDFNKSLDDNLYEAVSDEKKNNFIQESRLIKENKIKKYMELDEKIKNEWLKIKNKHNTAFDLMLSPYDQDFYDLKKTDSIYYILNTGIAFYIEKY